MSSWRKIIRKVGSAGGSLLVLGPLWVGAPKAIASGSPQGALQTYMHETFGIYVDTGQVDTQFLIQQVVPRDIALVGAGMFVKWLARRA